MATRAQVRSVGALPGFPNYPEKHVHPEPRIILADVAELLSPSGLCGANIHAGITLEACWHLWGGWPLNQNSSTTILKMNYLNLKDEEKVFSYTRDSLPQKLVLTLLMY